jgi:hypothetical protein
MPKPLQPVLPSGRSSACESSTAGARWRKRKGIAHVRLEGGEVRLAEVHWYEAHGIGRKEFKIKRYID